ncbi:glycosyltransferase [Chrysiogenes arsenatis]|uniref:glycosyltransferase n=1 Tax=Chrysiogenes arsenatis TaxID=309797 RepID=UPI00041614FB|nr:glycosyltransferase [Chrysiogenes arsenatis]
MKIIISGGGTGGHFYPAMSTLQEFTARGIETYYIGATQGIEAQLIQNFTPQHTLLELSGVLGKSIGQRITALRQLAAGVVTLRTLYRSIKPDAVIGFGGYASAAALLAGATQRIPLFLHEQNSVTGLTNTLLAKIATATFSAFGNLGETVGLPLRQTPPLRPWSERQHLLILGGSQGSISLNTFVAHSLPQLIEHTGVPIYHQVGGRNYEPYMQEIMARYQTIPHNYHPFAFRDDIQELMATACGALARSGASSAFELMAAKVPTLFIPFPYAAYDHQYGNADYFSREGAAQVCREADFKVHGWEVFATFWEGREAMVPSLERLSVITLPATLCDRVLSKLHNKP